MNACGLIVEYNPFHYGHLHHVEEAKKAADADCMIAVMSGTFLQRGEPAIIDKFHRTRAAIASGVDIVIELPYAYAVESSALFAEGAVKSLEQMGVSSICFGSESGEIDDFLIAYQTIEKQQKPYKMALHSFLDKGDNFPTASHKAYQTIGLDNIDLVKPNNILGFSYVRAIKQLELSIRPLTIQRIQNDYHDEEIENPIASATSIRKEILNNGFSKKIADTLPAASLNQLKGYKTTTNILHDWEKYFPFLQYQVINQSLENLYQIQGMNEGLEYRIKSTVNEAESFRHWLQLVKTKRYTQTRLQRIFVHILTNTTKQSIKDFIELPQIPYIRLLGLSEKGRMYLNQYKKQMDVPLYSSLNKKNKMTLELDEKANQVYYSVLPIKQRELFRQQEFQLPIINETGSHNK